MNFPSIRIEGAILSPDILGRIEDAPGQKPADFGLDPSAKVKDEIARAWADAQDCRQPLSEYFTRSTFAKRWTAIPFAEKEAVAADMRRNLARIRNEAAKAHPRDLALHV